MGATMFKDTKSAVSLSQFIRRVRVTDEAGSRRRGRVAGSHWKAKPAFSRYRQGKLVIIIISESHIDFVEELHLLLSILNSNNIISRQGVYRRERQNVRVNCFSWGFVADNWKTSLPLRVPH